MKKGNLLTEFFVKIVIAFLMVGLLIWFAVALWGALFPGVDAATLKSFESLSDAIISQGNKNIPASYINTQIYFTDSSYKILVFENEKVTFNDITWLRPADCKDSKCICLYNGLPNQEDKEENVVRCKIFPSSISIVRFDLTNSNGKTINQEKSNKFYTVIIFQNKTSDNNNEISVILNLDNKNKENQDMVKKWVSEKNPQ